jgi:tetratricopeptide (TPR) repeat protein
MERDRHATLRHAVAAQGAGKCQEAERLYRLLLTANPGDIEARVRLHSLSTVKEDCAPSEENLNELHHLYNTNSLQKAERLARSLCKRFSGHLVAWKVLGAILLRLENYREAAEASQKAVDLSPKDFESLHNLGTAQAAVGNFDEAEKCYRAVIALQPSFSPTHNNLGITLKTLGRFHEAEAAYREAIALDSTCASAHSNLGNTLAALGDVEGAMSSLEEALRLRPHFAEAHRYLAAIKHFEEKDEQYAMMSALHQRPETSPDQRCHLSFGLAKASEDLGLFENAFRYYSEGNSFRKQSLKYNISEDRDLFAHLKLAHPEVMKARTEVVSEGPEIVPVFVIGMPRSGTTLVEQIISSHSEVIAAGELTHVANLGRSIATGDVQVTPELIKDFRDKYLKEIRKINKGAAFVVDTGPQNFLYLGLIHAAFPEAKLVHVQRNAAAVCWANFKNYFPSTSFGYCYALDDVAAYYSLYEGLMAYWKDALPDIIFEVDYELLTVRQKTQTCDLIRYLGLDWEESCLRPEENERPVATASNLQIREKVHAGSSLKWRNFAPYIGDAFDAL